MSRREIYSNIGGRVIYSNSATARRIDITDELLAYLGTPTGEAFYQLAKAARQPLTTGEATP